MRLTGFARPRQSRMHELAEQLLAEAQQEADERVAAARREEKQEADGRVTAAKQEAKQEAKQKTNLVIQIHGIM